MYNLEINYRNKIIPKKIKLPYELEILQINKYLSKVYKDYDLFIDSNNTTFKAPNIPTISYVHFPRKSRVINYQKKTQNKINYSSIKYDLINMVAKKLYKKDEIIRNNNSIIVNSEYSKRKFFDAYPSFKREVEVIYPPIDIKFSKNDERNSKSICSLGRFTEQKGQLKIIKIAEKIKNFDFHLIGFAEKENKYYQKCLNYIENKSIQNVFLHRNATHKEKNQILSKCTYFFHIMEDEPFGIITVEAIMNGLIPIVSNSGGQPEIVPIPELTFNSLEEIPMSLKRFSSKEDRISVLDILQKNIKKFDSKNFNEKFGLYFENIIRGLKL